MVEGCGLLSLPQEMLERICRYLSEPEDIVRLGATCRLLKTVAGSDSIWRPLVLRDYHEEAGMDIRQPGEEEPVREQDY